MSNAVSNLVFWVVLCTVCAVAGAQAEKPLPTPHSFAHSALLSADATETDDSLLIHIRRVADQTPVISHDVTATLGGKNQPVTAQGNGTYLIPAGDLHNGAQRTLDITVGHDGIREVLTGKLSIPETSTSSSLLGDHKQIAWWILNIAVVLIAAIALSRRKSDSGS